jgi:hypothetical protein
VSVCVVLCSKKKRIWLVTGNLEERVREKESERNYFQ